MNEFIVTQPTRKGDMTSDQLCVSPDINREEDLQSKQRNMDSTGTTSTTAGTTSNTCEMNGQSQCQTKNVTTDMTIQEHERFIAALEKHGRVNTGEEFKLIAQELGSEWTSDRVKEYAFWYLNMLDSFNNKDADLPSSRGNDYLNQEGIQSKDDLCRNYSNENGEEEQLWNHQECILYDSLLATHPGGVTSISLAESDKIDRWGKIAAMMPNKTAGQCRDRYLAFYEGGGCKL
jgi:hypothetical protein